MNLRMKHAGFKLGRVLMYVSVSLLFLSCQSSENESESLLQYVDPFVGTTYTGHTFPGATYPWDLCNPVLKPVISDGITVRGIDMKIR